MSVRSPLTRHLRNAMLGVVAISGLSILSSGVIAAAAPTTTKAPTSSVTTTSNSKTPTTTSATVTPNLAAKCASLGATAEPGQPIDQSIVAQGQNTSEFNAGTPYSDVKCVNSSGEIVGYGNSAIFYTLPTSNPLSVGEELFLTYCSACHGVKANGVPAGGTTGIYPNLLGLGPATINFWITTGRMPAVDPRGVQAQRRTPRLTDKQANEVAAYINSLQPATAGPYVPNVNLRGANVENGQNLFALNCAACHTITGGGDALAYNTYAPTLHWATPNQIAEALRTGPGNMPRFTGNLTDWQVRDIVAYVSHSIQHPTNIGGVGLGGLGPVAEGFVALALGVGGLMLVTFWVGDRQ